MTLTDMKTPEAAATKKKLTREQAIKLGSMKTWKSRQREKKLIEKLKQDGQNADSNKG